MHPEDIPGWFAEADAAMFRWFLAQPDDNGDLAEIGPYLGRSAVVIGAHQKPGETFTVIDLFGDPAPDASNSQEAADQYAGFTRTQFEANYRAVLGTLPVIVQAPSADLPQYAKPAVHRFIHVDGSHLCDVVREDITTAHVLLANDGIVAFDDITSAHTPGVWAAVWEAVVTRGLLPVAVSEHKMYATWGDYKAWQRRFLAAPPRDIDWEEQEVLGRPLLRVWSTRPASPAPLWRRAAKRALVRR